MIFYFPLSRHRRRSIENIRGARQGVLEPPRPHRGQGQRPSGGLGGRSPRKLLHFEFYYCHRDKYDFKVIVSHQNIRWAKTNSCPPNQNIRGAIAPLPPWLLRLCLCAAIRNIDILIIISYTCS